MEKSQILFNLRELRLEIERETGGLLEEQALLLTDVCQALGLADTETLYIVGDAFHAIVSVPIQYTLTERGMAPVPGRALMNPVEPLQPVVASQPS